jgi:hypothetical protein
MINMKKLRLIHSFPMIYHVHKSDKRLENEEQNTAWYEKIRETNVSYI